MPGPRGFRHPIYGVAKAKANACTNIVEALSAQYYKLVTQIERLIDTAIESTDLTLEIIGQVNTKVTVDVKIYVRLVWRSQYYPQKFDDTNPGNVSQILSIYYAIREPWSAPTDPLFQTPIGLAVLANDKNFVLQNGVYVYFGPINY